MAKSDQKPRRAFDVDAFLKSGGAGCRVVQHKRGGIIFMQGDPATAVMYLQHGAVKLSRVSPNGREAVLAVVGPGTFFGEACLAGAEMRDRTATAITPAHALSIERETMRRHLQNQPALTTRLLQHLLERNRRLEDDLVDQLLNSSEKRLARVLLLLGRPDPTVRVARRVPRPSQEMLAEMIGTTRPRVNVFMNKFRRLGHIDYGAKGLRVHASLAELLRSD